MGLSRVLDFLGQLIDVFCKFFNIDMKNIVDLQQIAETVRTLIDQVGQQLSQLFGRLALTGKSMERCKTNKRVFLIVFFFR